MVTQKVHHKHVKHDLRNQQDPLNQISFHFFADGNTTLSIESMDYPDTGIYKCLASNVAAEHEATASLFIQQNYHGTYLLRKLKFQSSFKLSFIKAKIVYLFCVPKRKKLLRW